jgi:lysophospholipase L1-like esterase
MLGDSMTGQGDWSSLLPKVKVLNSGIGGDTSAGVLNRLERSVSSEFHTVFVMIGINDLMLKRSVFDIYHNYIKIIEKLVSMGKTVIIQSTLYVAKELHEINQNINHGVTELNRRINEYCDNSNIQFIDINQVLSSNEVLKPEYSVDSVHINTQAYIEWAKLIEDEVEKYQEHLIKR